MDKLTIIYGGIPTEKAPASCAVFRERLPFRNKAIHVRWSGQDVWVPLGDTEFGVGWENATSYPAPDEIILYPGGLSETEILIAYGRVSFASMAVPLAGNHFITITGGLDRLAELGHRTLWGGRPGYLLRDRLTGRPR